MEIPFFANYVPRAPIHRHQRIAAEIEMERVAGLASASGKMHFQARIIIS